jgi:hypothetical protein
VTLQIADDFAAIHARMQEIEATRRPAAGAAPAKPPAAVPASSSGGEAQYAEFYAWLKDTGRWTPG